MAGSFELYSPEGLRSDGRRYAELRKFECTMHTHPHAADGSARVQMGPSRVECLVHGPKEPSLRSKSQPSGMTLTFDLTIAPFAGQDRDKRPKNSRSFGEIIKALEDTYNQAILRHLSPHTEVSIHLVVLELEGVTLPLCLNAVTLALIDAGIPLLEFVSSCSVALCESASLLDPNGNEENELPTVAAATLGKSDEFVFVSSTRKLPLERLSPALDLVLEGCHAVRAELEKEVRRYGAQRMARQVR